MPLDTIGLYNKLQSARDKSRAVSAETKPLDKEQTIFISSNEIVPGIKSISIRNGAKPMPAGMLLFDPLDVELVVGEKPKSASEAVVAVRTDDIGELVAQQINVSLDQTEQKSGYPDWRFLIIEDCKESRVLHAIKHRLAKRD